MKTIFDNLTRKLTVVALLFATYTLFAQQQMPLTWRDIAVPLPPAHAKNIKKDFGAKGDGKTDDSPAFMKAAKTGSAIVIPPGTYLINTPFEFTSGLQLYGVDNPVLHIVSETGLTAQGVHDVGSFGIVYRGKGIQFTGGADGYDRRLTFIGNTFEHIWDGSNGITAKYVSDLVLRGNKFIDIIGIPGGWEQYRGRPWNPDGSGFWAFGFGDHIDLSFNYFEHIGYNGLKGFFNGPDVSHDFRSTNNEFRFIHRIASEFQHCSNNENGCLTKGGAGSSVVAPYMANNFAYDFWYPNKVTFGMSWPIDQNVNGVYMNNTVIQTEPCCMDPDSHLGYGIEVSGYAVLAQGNVVGISSSTVNNGFGWGASIGTDRLFGGLITMNVICGPNSKIHQGADGGPTDNATPHNFVDSRVCPCKDGDLAKSDIRAGWDGRHLWVVSNLSIIHVAFYVGDADVPEKIQTQQDANENFAEDRRWHYSFARTGTVKVRAVIADVSGQCKTVVF
ncbi:glycosyl hydrolase family 28-related protein [Parapedobacter sp. DT-150]|uniref:glycosyl hydrolase family 28-related protein n=1 Tax=Parapedobacter sp. DT-150 TaxID=3396162 RepID=UPI003F1C6D3F